VRAGDNDESEGESWRSVDSESESEGWREREQAYWGTLGRAGEASLEGSFRYRAI
jgi:hypothetical protein